MIAIVIIVYKDDLIYYEINTNVKTDNIRILGGKVMNLKKTDIYFENTFTGKLVVPNGEIPIGSSAGTVGPYDMLIGALAGCLYSTFLDVVEKKKGFFDTAEFHIDWEKRTEIPKTLKMVKITLIIKGAEEKDKPGMEKAAELAAKYCSIYQTISCVADMSVEVVFE
ncbi:MAG: OsmC family protein [Peptostreptococcaceae bacterium]|nr:OsmC family protein [Peptostreptococcaceae bacterium]